MIHTEDSRKLLSEKRTENSVLQVWEHVIDGHKEKEMVIDGIYIMASYNNLSSELLITNSLAKTRNTENVKVLIGGLGMGFTLKEAAKFKEIQDIHVVELQPTVLEWNKTFYEEYNGGALNDKRVKVILGDFYDYVLKTANKYDIISMDIDNGPMMLVKEDNSRVYNLEFFKRIKQILNSGGVFVIWSCTYDPQLIAEAKKIYKDCEMEEIIENHHGKKVPYYLYFVRN